MLTDALCRFERTGKKDGRQSADIIKPHKHLPLHSHFHPFYNHTPTQFVQHIPTSRYYFDLQNVPTSKHSAFVLDGSQSKKKKKRKHKYDNFSNVYVPVKTDLH